MKLSITKGNSLQTCACTAVTYLNTQGCLLLRQNVCSTSSASKQQTTSNISKRITWLVCNLNIKFTHSMPSVLWRCWLGGWLSGGVLICLWRGADLHMAQLMPLPLTISCYSKSSLALLVLAHPGSPGQRAVKRCCCILRRNAITK